jgi:hypothetical protein
MQLIPSWEAASHSATQEHPKMLWNPKVTIINSTKNFNLLLCICKHSQYNFNQNTLISLALLNAYRWV